MAKLLYFIPFLFLTTIPSYPQDNATSPSAELSWNEYYKLEWEDFQGEPGKNSRGDAGAAVMIKAKPFLVRKEVRYDVAAIFDRSKSWARGRSISLLAHEQLHFDIAELYARKIRKKTDELNAQGETSIKRYNAAIQELLRESNEVDERYDLETLHGALSKKQAAWSKKVKAELTSLKKYKKPKRMVGG